MNKRINVLFVAHSITMGGGANRSMFQLMLELRDNYHINPIILIPVGKSSGVTLEDVCIQENIPVIKAIVPWFFHSNVIGHRFKYIFSYLHYPILISKIRKCKIDLVHSNGSVIDLGVRISQSLGVPHIWHLREFGTESGIFKDVLWKSYRKDIYKKGDAFIAISDVIKKHYVNEGLIPAEKIHRIYNGISTETYNQVAKHENSVTQFVMVGVITPYKNQFEAVKATKLLLSEGIKDFYLTLIGNDKSSYANEIKDYIYKNKLEDHVQILGLRNDVPALLSKMDVGLMLSHSEAFGRVTVEYMFQNLAVIGSNTGANPEIIENGKTGLLYHIGNINDLSNCMKLLINNHGMLLNLSKNGRQFALSTFPSKKNSNEINNLYHRILRI